MSIGKIYKIRVDFGKIFVQIFFAKTLDKSSETWYNKISGTYGRYFYKSGFKSEWKERGLAPSLFIAWYPGGLPEPPRRPPLRRTWRTRSTTRLRGPKPAWRTMPPEPDFPASKFPIYLCSSFLFLLLFWWWYKYSTTDRICQAFFWNFLKISWGL